jgi:lipid-binding SYLF domain-containing protein
MFPRNRILGIALVLSMLLATQMGAPPARAESAAALDHDVNAALKKLYETTPIAKALAKKAKGILVFPNVVKAGFLVGGQYGEGAMRARGKTVGYYNIAAASYGLQAGAQAFGYVMLFMTDGAIEYFQKSEGFEVGVGPSVVLVDEGMAKTLTTTTAQSDVYAFIFGQKGLMAGLGLQGSKITKVDKS